MRYHITITDNKTGEVIREADTNAYTAVYDNSDKISRSRGLAVDINTVCNLAEVLLIEYNEIIELLPERLRRIVRKETTKRAKKDLKKKGNTNK